MVKKTKWGAIRARRASAAASLHPLAFVNKKNTAFWCYCISEKGIWCPVPTPQYPYRITKKPFDR